MNIKELEKLKIGMWVKTTTGLIATVKEIDLRFPLGSEIKFPIIYTHDGKTCWSLEFIESYGWEKPI